MNEHLKKLIESGILIVGEMTKQDGFVVFQRMDKKDLETLDPTKIAFATKSMGRGIFTFSKDKRILNYKGVDSHLENSESICQDLISANAINIPLDDKMYSKSSYPLNLVVFPGGSLDVRFRGTSPLEDLEIEAFINRRMQATKIKTPQILSVREFTQEFLQRYHLPVNVQGTFDDFTSDYRDENSEIKKFLRENYGGNYREELVQGKRPESLSEYFARINISENEELRAYLDKYGVTMEDFVASVDKSYSLGQRYGQTERILENPFRIADIEYYTKQGDVETLENIIGFSESLYEEDIPLENYFAIQTGKNLAELLNNGWICENFAHRQDFTLAGEMCDDAYQYLPHELEKMEAFDDGKRNALQIELKKKFLYQIYAISSSIKSLQDEMILRGKNDKDIESVLQDFVYNFTQNIDMEKISSFIGRDAKTAFEILVKKPANYEKILARKQTHDGIIFDEQVLLGQRGRNAFFDSVSSEIADNLEIGRTFIEENHHDTNDSQGEER